MSRTVLTEVEGFTPLIDSIVSDLGVMQAAVFGRVWRYCQMENQICYAAVETLAEELNLSPNCISGHLKELVSADYLTEVKRSGKTTVYKDTGKAALSMKITANLPPQNLGRSQAIPPQNLGTTPPEFGEVPPQNLGTKIVSNKESKIEKIKKEIGADAPPPQKKEKRAIPKEKAPKDPNMEHPAVKAYREIVKLTPNEIQRRTLAERVSDFSAWRKTLVSWMLHGWSPRNIEGMINSYETGGNGNGRAYAPAAQQSFEDIPIFQGRHE